MHDIILFKVEHLLAVGNPTSLDYNSNGTARTQHGTIKCAVDVGLPWYLPEVLDVLDVVDVARGRSC